MCSLDTLDSLNTDIDVLQLNVEGITCSHCADSIKRALNEFENIKSVNVGITDGIVQITGTNLDKTQIAETITSLGFKPV